MKLTDSFQGVTRLFLDSAPVIYYIEENTRYLSIVEPITVTVMVANTIRY
ncbi:MAG: hypothetical protein DSM106950_06305 [Stigonema ocellatum SAG 48.90 = DSM 106950]|nr:hypothetical protein [Stigonema ocellatum SAG 48.90 = DSM 106950]